MVFNEPAAEVIFTMHAHIIALGYRLLCPLPYGKGGA